LQQKRRTKKQASWIIIYCASPKPEHNSFILVITGEISINGTAHHTSLKADTLAILGDGNELSIKAQKDSHFLLISGKPFNEPVARYGPFVMNTQDEIHQVFYDYRQGNFFDDGD
jgi:quercetin 2,3-dioxygenase